MLVTVWFVAECAVFRSLLTLRRWHAEKLLF